MDGLATRLMQRIQFVDASVFPENPLPVIIAPESLGGDPRENQAQFAFAHDTSDPSNRNDFYVIFEKGLRDWFDMGRGAKEYAESVAKACKLRLKLGKDDLSLVELIPYDEDRALIGAAVHEVRHRVQCHLKITMLTQYHTNRVKRCSMWGRIQAKHYGNDPNGMREFDAKFFESYWLFEFEQGRLQFSSECLRNLLLMNPKDFLDKEKNG